MDKIEFEQIDRLHNPQRFVSATFDNEYVTFVKLEQPVDEPKVIAKIECIRRLLTWIDDKSVIRVYGFNCKTDNRANVFWITWADQWVLLHFLDENKVVHHEFLSIESLRKLVREMQFRANT